MGAVRYLHVRLFLRRRGSHMMAGCSPSISGTKHCSYHYCQPFPPANTNIPGFHRNSALSASTVFVLDEALQIFSDNNYGRCGYPWSTFYSLPEPQSEAETILKPVSMSLQFRQRALVQEWKNLSEAFPIFDSEVWLKMQYMDIPILRSKPGQMLRIQSDPYIDEECVILESHAVSMYNIHHQFQIPCQRWHFTEKPIWRL